MYYIIVGSFKPAMEPSILNNMYFGYFNTETSGPIPNGEIKSKDGVFALVGLVFKDDCLEFTQVHEDGRSFKHSLKWDRSAACQLNAWVGTCCDASGNIRNTKCIINCVDLKFLA